MTGALFSLIIFLATLFSIVGFGAILHWRKDKKTSLFHYVIYLTILNVGLQSATASGRNLFAAPYPIAAQADSVSAVVEFPAPVLWLSRISSLFIVFFAIELIVNRLLRYGRGEKIPGALMIAFVFYFVTSVLFSAFLSAHPSMAHEYFYLLLAGVAVLLLNEADVDNAICSTRTAILLLLIVSAIFIPIKPELVVQNNYVEGLIPGLTYRYVGLTGHSNSIGAIDVVFLLCLWNRPYAKVWLNYCAWLIGLLTLIFAQSKTSWIMFLMCMACLAYFGYIDYLKKYLVDFKRPMLSVILLSMCMAAITGIVGLIIFGPTSNPLNSFFATRAGAELMTLTNRSYIWEIAVREWHRNPLFGYGLTIWDEEYRAIIGVSSAVHAHNQFYQTLSSSGIFGVIGLLVYVLTLFWFSLKTVRASKGLTLAFFLMLMLRSVSEVTLSMIGHFGANELTNSLMLMLIVSYLPGRKNEVPSLIHLSA